MIRFLTSSPCGRVVPAVFVLMLVAAIGVALQPGTWAANGDLPENLYFAATAVVDGTIYTFGGSNGQGVVGSVYANHPLNNDPPSYKMTVDTWAKKTDMPTPRSMAAAAVVNGRIFVIGGALDSNDFMATAVIEVFDPKTNRWQSKHEMPVALWGAAAAVVDGRIFVIGGGIGDALGERSVFSSVQVYDPENDSWDTAADMPTARGILSASVVDGVIYAIGGSEKADTTGALEIYDPATDTWSTGTDLLTYRDSLATAVVDGMVYALGGYAWGRAGSPRIVREVEVYDPSDDTWAQVTRMPDPRWGLSVAVVKGTIHLIGGANALALAGTKAVDTYDPDRYTFWTEVAAHIEGSFGSQWRTAICAVNTSGGSANVQFVLHGEDGEHSALTKVIETDKMAHFEDIVGAMEGTGKGMLEVRSDQHLRLAGRIYNDGPDGTFGQQCDFMAMDGGFEKGDEVWLVGLRQQEGLFRTNITVANTGIRLGTVGVRLFSCDGIEACNFLRWVDPGSFEQMIEPFANECGQPDVGWGYAKFYVAAGAGIRISASVIDSRTNDATTVMGKR